MTGIRPLHIRSQLKRSFAAPIILAYMVVVLTLVFVAFVPGNVNLVVYIILLILAFPASLVSLVVSLCAAAIIFGDPNSHSPWLRLMLCAIWTVGALVNAFLFASLRQRLLARQSPERQH